MGWYCSKVLRKYDKLPNRTAKVLSRFVWKHVLGLDSPKAGLEWVSTLFIAPKCLGKSHHPDFASQILMFIFSDAPDVLDNASAFVS